MKTINSLLLLVFLFTACAEAEKEKSEQEKPVKEQEYFIAYNIHSPDTTVDDWEIMLMNTDGTEKRNITNHKDVAWIYHSYGKRLFFISDRDTAYRNYFLYEMNSEGKNIRKISELRLEDSWMSGRKNGDEIIVTGRIGKEIRHQLFLLDTKTGKYQQITHDTAAHYSDPCFSPDGKQIVFSYQKNKRDKNSHEELFLMNEDGTKMKQLTHYPEENISAREYGYKAGAARWNPEENFISYVSFQDGRNHIFAVTPDGHKQWELFETDLSVSWHDWSSDGKYLTFNGTADDKQFHIYIMDWKTKEIKLLTDTTFHSQLGPVIVEK